jgi:hypothetical protein
MFRKSEKNVVKGQYSLHYMKKTLLSRYLKYSKNTIKYLLTKKIQ